MAAGDVTPGRRRDVEMHLMEPGDYGHMRAGGSHWFCCVPSGHHGGLNAHEVVEHEDGTITVSPSILVTRPGHPDPMIAAGWHGYVERGVWREV